MPSSTKPQPDDTGPIGPLVTVSQIEQRNPGLAGRTRQYIMRADAGMVGFDGLSQAVLRVGRSVLIDEPRFLNALSRINAGKPPDAARNPHGRAGTPDKAKQVARRKPKPKPRPKKPRIKKPRPASPSESATAGA